MTGFSKPRFQSIRWHLKASFSSYMCFLNDQVIFWKFLSEDKPNFLKVILITVFQDIQYMFSYPIKVENWASLIS